MRLSLLIVFIFILQVNCFAEKRAFRISQNCSAAYQSFISFKIKEGRQHLLKEIKQDPNNAFIFLIQNYEDFIVLNFKEDPAEYTKRKKRKEQRLKILDQAQKNTPHYLLSKGIIHLQWSIIHIKYKEFFKAAVDFKKAFGYFKSNIKKYPNFKDNNIFFGAQQAIIGTIPDNYRWISNTLGLKGNIKNGMNLLRQSVRRDNKIFQADAKFFYIYLTDILLNKSSKALALIDTYSLDTKNVYLYTFMKSNLELNNFKAAKSIVTIHNRNKSSAYLQPQIFEYQKGVARLYLGQYNSAINNLNRFLKSKSYYYKKDACAKIAQAYYLKKNVAAATSYKKKIRTIGTSITDIDKQALRFAKAPPPDFNLLKARLLFDGGNFSASIKLLKSEALKENTTKNYQLERIYRLARNYDQDHQLTLAIRHYEKTLSLPNPDKAYFPARAALQLAYIYENQGKKALAINYFKKVLTFNEHEFKTSLDHRAKSGILRLQGK